MSEQETNQSAVTEIIKSLSPVVMDIYDDALRPTAREVGRLGETLSKAINVVIAPLRIAVIGLDARARQLEDGLKARLENAEPKIISPPPNVAVPALAAFAYCADIPELREMYLNLLASSMYGPTTAQAHPSYVEIIRQLTSDEAKVIHLFKEVGSLPLWQMEFNRHALKDGLGYFEVDLVMKRLSLIAEDAKCEHPTNVPGYVDNLIRLGLVYETRKRAFRASKVAQLNSPHVEDWSGGKIYHGGKRLPELIEANPIISSRVEHFESDTDYLQVWYSDLRLTPFGRSFCLTCVTDSVMLVADESGHSSTTVMAEEAL